MLSQPPGSFPKNKALPCKAKPSKIIIISVLALVAAVLSAFLILCIVTASLYSPTFLCRVITHWDSDVSDYKIFPERIINKSDMPYYYPENINPSLGNITVDYRNRQKTLNEFVECTDTTSFLIVKNDEMVYEKYANGYDKNSINTSFSMAKSVVSLLIGRAVESGYIDSVTQPISDYIDEFKGSEIGKTTIEELLLMRSDIVYNEEKFLWLGDDSLTYWYPDLRELALTHRELTEDYKGKFHYNNYHPLLLGIILERSTGMPVSQYFEREIWQKIGAEYDASWSLCSENGFEKMESGINFRAVDFIKIGSMVLHSGLWNGSQIIDSEWLDVSTSGSAVNNDDYENSFLDGKNIGYKYMWYYTPSSDGMDIIAWGKSDQLLYISPANNLVILRTGKSDGGISNWMEKIKEIITKIKT